MKRVPIIKRARLSALEISTILAHLLISYGLWACYDQRLIEHSTLKRAISNYYFIAPMLIVSMMFRNLRNFYFFLPWVVIGITQMMFFFDLCSLYAFQVPRGSAFDSLKSMLPTVLMFQILRVIFIEVNNLEMIVSIRKYRMSWWEVEENREMTGLEVAFSLLLMATWIIAAII